MRFHESLVLAILALVIPAGASAQGPFVNSVSITSQKPPIFGFIDISTTGTAVLDVSDGTFHIIDLPTFLNNAFFPILGDFGVSSNGVMSMNVAPGSFADFNNQPIPASGVPPGLPAGPTVIHLCPWWDDLAPINPPSDTTIYWQHFEGLGVLIVQWNDQTHGSLMDPNKTVTFQVQLFDSDLHPACDRQVQFLYDDAIFGSGITENGGGSATIGVAGQLGNAQLSFNAPFIANGTVLTISATTAGRLNALAGFGSLSIQYVGNCVPDFQFLAVTFQQGSFPNGWLFGVDMPINQLAAQLASGPPFTFSPGGTFFLGEFFGLPPITFYSVVVAIDNGVLLGGSNAIMVTIL